MSPRPAHEPIAVTGMGIVSPIGNHLDAFWQATVRGDSGITNLERFDTARFPCRFAGQVRDLEQSPFYEQGWGAYDRVSRLGLAAAVEALSQAEVRVEEEGYEDYGVFVGTGVGGVESHEDTCRIFYSSESSRVHPTIILRVMCNATAAHIAQLYGLAGPSQTTVTACTSSSQAIGEACETLARGDARLIVAGGTDAPLSPVLFGAWNAMRVLSRWKGDPGGACRPFSADRSGLVISEGAAFLVLERPAHARARGAEILGYIHAYATNTTHNHLTKPSISHEVRAMQGALRKGGVPPEDLAYVHAHGTGTVTNDPAETEAIKQALGAAAQKIPVSSGKSQYGHTLGAAGAIGCVSALLALRNRTAPPTINLEKPDPRCDLNYVPNSAQPLERGAYALVNAFGFGGNNAVLLIGGPESLTE